MLKLFPSVSQDGEAARGEPEGKGTLRRLSRETSGDSDVFGRWQSGRDTCFHRMALHISTLTRGGSHNCFGRRGHLRPRPVLPTDTVTPQKPARRALPRLLTIPSPQRDCPGGPGVGPSLFLPCLVYFPHFFVHTHQSFPFQARFLWPARPWVGGRQRAGRGGNGHEGGRGTGPRPWGGAFVFTPRATRGEVGSDSFL